MGQQRSERIWPLDDETITPVVPEREPRRGPLALLIAPIVVLVACGYVADALWPTLVESHPLWLRFISGTSAFVYVIFYVLLIIAIVKRWNWIQLPSVIYATMIIALTGIPIFGVEFFGAPGERTPNPAVFLAYNLPYIVFPLILLIRMRKPKPFTRAF